MPEAFADLFKPDSDAAHNGLMVGYWLDAETAGQLAIEGGEAAEDLHLTLCYCGDTAAYDDATIAAMILEVAKVAAEYGPLEGRIGGIGRFTSSNSSDGRDVVVAQVDVPGLAELRQALAECLQGVGALSSQQHGWNPHITLAYIEAGAAMPVESLPELPLQIDKLTVAVGDRQASFALQLVADLVPADAGIMLAGELAEVAARGRTWRLFNQFEFGELPLWIPFLPRPGRYKHPRYGEVAITRERNERFVGHVNGRTYGQDLPVDAEHETKLSGALAYIKEARVNGDGSADARVEWTDRGRTMVGGGRFKYFSPEWYDAWTDPATGQRHEDVAIGGALTTRPFFKEGAMRPLIASERGLAAGGDDFQQGDGTVMSEKEKELEGRLAALEAEIKARQAAEQAATSQAQQLAEQNKKLSEQVATMQADARRQRFTELTAPADGPAWFGEGHVAILETLANTFGEDSTQFKGYVQQQQAIAEQLAMSELFRERGSDRSGDGGALGRIEAETRKLMAEDKNLTYEQAYTAVLERNPKLYNEYEAGR